MNCNTARVYSSLVVCVFMFWVVSVVVNNFGLGKLKWDVNMVKDLELFLEFCYC